MAVSPVKQKENERLYEFTVAGLVRVQNGSEKSELPYEEVVTLDGELISEGALHVMVKYDLPEILRAKHPGYVALATHNITKAKALDGSRITNPAIMGRNELEQYIEYESLNIDVALFPDDDALRQAIAEFKEDPKGFEIMQAKRRKIKGPELQILNKRSALKARLANQNSEPEVPAPPVVSGKKGKANSYDGI